MATGAVLAGTLLFTAACSDEVGLAPEPKPATLKVVSSPTVTTAPGLTVDEPVIVVLQSSNQTAIPNHLVRFTITGSGTATGAHVSVDSAYTDENGRAQVFITPGTAGTYTVTATAEGVPAATVTVNAIAPVADAIFVYAGDQQGGFAGEPIAPFTAKVLNDVGLPQPGVAVTFTVTSGGGSVSPTVVTTNARGEASTVLTLGSAPTQTVTATAAGLTASASTNTSATFTATVAPPCTVARPIAVPQTKNSSLDALDCLTPQNRRVEFYKFTTTAPLTSILVTETSSAFTPSLTVSKPGGTDTLAIEPSVSSAASYRIFAPAGTWWLGASSTGVGATGSFTLTTATSTVSNDNCPTTPIYVLPGSTIQGNIATSDCVFSGDVSQHADVYYIYLRAGQQIRINLQAVPLAATSIDLWIRVRNMTTGAFNNTDCCGGSTVESRLHTAANDGVYRIETGVYYDPTAPTPQTGAYQLDILTP